MPVGHCQPPRRIVCVLRRQMPQRGGLGRVVFRKSAARRPPGGQGVELDEKHEPGRPLVGPQCGKPLCLATGHGGKEPGKRDTWTLRERQDRICEEIHGPEPANMRRACAICF